MMLSSGTLGNRRLRIVAEGVGYQECLVKNTQYFSRFILNSQFEKVFPIALGSCGFVAQNMSFSTVVCSL